MIGCTLSKAEQLRLRGELCAEQAQLQVSEPERRRLQRLADGWRAVSEAQRWLDGEMPPLGTDDTFCERLTRRASPTDAAL
jgi:hypothetical protein